MRRVRGMWLVALGLILLAAPLFAGPGSEKPPAAGGTQWTIPYKGPEVELSVWMMTPAENPQDVVDKPNPYTAAQMKRLGNIKWKIYGNAVADYDARFPVLAASGPLYDINVVRSAPETTRNFGPSGQMLNLMDYLDKVPNAKKWLLDKYPKTLTGTTKDGKPGWFVVGVTGDGLTEMPEVYLYNKTLLDKYGIAVPKTSDEMLAAMKKLKAADPKIIPWIYMWKSFADMVWYSGLHDMFTQIRPTSIWWQPAKNKWVYGPIEPDGGLKETLQFVHEMYKNGLTNPDQESQTGDQFKAIAQSGLWGFTYTYYNEARVQPNGKGMILAGKRYEIKGMEIPKGTTGKNYLLWGSRAGGPGWGTCFNAKTKYPELIAALVNYMWSDENILAMNYGIEGETYTKDASGNPKFLPDWNTAITPTGYKDLNNWGLGSGVFPHAGVNFQSVRFNRYYDLGILGEAAVQVRALRDGKYSGQILEFDPNEYMDKVFTAAENDQIGKIMGPANTYVEENVSKFVKGQRSFDDWPAFVQELKNMGVEKAVEIFNARKTTPPAAWTKDELNSMLKSMYQVP